MLKRLEMCSNDWIQTTILHRFRIILVAIGMILISTPSHAHPMGNFSISHYAGITVERNYVELRYIVDMAEIPTFQEMQQYGIAPGDTKLPNYLATKSKELSTGLHLRMDGEEMTLQPVSEKAIFPPGAGGLPTMKVAFLYKAKMKPCKCEFSYGDSNFVGRAGWKEIVVKPGKDVNLVRSSVPEHDRSAQLSNYPTDLVNSPPQMLEARAEFAPSIEPASAIKTTRSAVSGLASQSSSPPEAKDGLTVAPSSQATDINQLAPNRQKTPRNAFTELIATREIGFGVALLAALIAAGLGALHALEPGHGKTIVAAYLVGAKGTMQHAFLLGMIVTITHTAGVYLLGAITLYAQKYILPEKLYPFLGVLTGIMIAGMGAYLFLQRYLGVELSLTHTHGARGHSHGMILPSAKPSSALNASKSISMRQLLLLGITGGLVPCPAALVVLLSALALHRVLFGLFLIVAFSVGLAAVLIAMGLAAVYAGRFMSQLKMEGLLIQRWLPLTSAAMITALGCVIAVRGLIAAGVVLIRI